MATFRRLLTEIRTIKDDIRAAFIEAESNREREYKAAVAIQSWYRGIKLRRNIYYLELHAIRIQRHWRGFENRRLYRVHLRQKLFMQQLEQYNYYATIIQKMWKGYYTRKSIHDYYASKRYFQALKTRNDEVRRELSTHEKRLQLQDLESAYQLEQKIRDVWVEKNHHLLSTFVSSGVYRPRSNPKRSNRRSGYTAEDAETLLRNAKPKPSRNFTDKINPSFALEKEYALDSAALPYYTTATEAVVPSHVKIPQKMHGPFKSPEEVVKQRYRPFKPSVRVQGDFFSVEKERERLKSEHKSVNLQDEAFKHTRIVHSPAPLPLNTAKPFEVLKYGTKQFRETQDPAVPFKTVLPPIHLFDHYNETYSRGTVGL